MDVRITLKGRSKLAQSLSASSLSAKVAARTFGGKVEIKTALWERLALDVLSKRSRPETSSQRFVLFSAGRRDDASRNSEEEMRFVRYNTSLPTLTCLAHARCTAVRLTFLRSHTSPSRALSWWLKVSALLTAHIFCIWSFLSHFIFLLCEWGQMVKSTIFASLPSPFDREKSGVCMLTENPLDELFLPHWEVMKGQSATLFKVVHEESKIDLALFCKSVVLLPETILSKAWI